MSSKFKMNKLGKEIRLNSIVTFLTLLIVLASCNSSVNKTEEVSQMLGSKQPVLKLDSALSNLDSIQLLIKSKTFHNVDSIQSLLNKFNEGNFSLEEKTTSSMAIKLRLLQLQLFEKDNKRNSFTKASDYVALSKLCLDDFSQNKQMSRTDSIDISLIYHHLLIINYHLGLFKEAEEAGQMEESFSENNLLKLVALKYYKALIYISMGQVDKALNKCKEIIKKIGENKDKNYEALFYAYSAFHEVYLYQNVDSLKFYSQKLFEIRDSLPLEMKLEALLYIVEYLGPQKAIQQMDDEKTSFMALTNVDKKEAFFFIRGDLFWQIKNYKSSMLNYFKAIDLRDSVFGERKRSQITYLEKKFKSAEKDKILAQNQLKIKSTIIAKNQYKYTLYVFTSFSIFILLLFFFFNKLRIRKKEIIIKEKYARKLLSLVEMNQREISNELHDRLGNDLLAIKILLHQKKLGGIPAIINNSISNLHDTVRLIYPIEVEKLAIRELIESQLDKMETLTVIKFVRNIEEVDLNKEYNLCVYRILQESIKNSIKHSFCDEIKVTLIKKGNKITLSIQDNGTGFNRKKVKDQFGLYLLEHRAKRIGSALQITSNKDGTLITLIIQDEKNIHTNSR